MGASNLKLILIGSTWDCITFHSFNSKFFFFLSWQVCDWLAKWLIVLGFMELWWPSVYRHSNVGLVWNYIYIFISQGNSEASVQYHWLTYAAHLTLATPWTKYLQIMMTSSNGSIFRVTGPLCGEFTGPRWIPLTKASNTELWCFLWTLPE